ncbi:DUF4003 family protein [Bacillus stercoris]|uniref:DUF4003 family protein n=1 Tax=Bacillus stercoris TaxID=2054641 RepID=UPI003D1EEBA4
MNKREFDFQRFYDLSSDIKSNIGSFTTLNTNTVLLLFLFWTIHFQHEAKQTFHTFIDVYNEMVQPVILMTETKGGEICHTSH